MIRHLEVARDTAIKSRLQMMSLWTIGWADQAFLPGRPIVSDRRLEFAA